jgi:hypothetical protein
MNLQQAMLFHWNNEVRKDSKWPWDSQDTRICTAWGALTNPRIELALEILSYQLPEAHNWKQREKPCKFAGIGTRRVRKNEFEDGGFMIAVKDGFQVEVVETERETASGFASNCQRRSTERAPNS